MPPLYLFPFSVPCTVMLPCTGDQNFSQDFPTFSNLVPCSKFNPLGNGENRTSVEDLSSFLTAMDSCIAINKKASISLIKSSK